MKRVARTTLKAGLALAVGCVLLELTLRWLIFSELPLARRLGGALREPSAFAAHECGTEWYLLRARMAAPELANFPCPTFDPHLGWRSDLIAPESYAHAEDASIGKRRPVLFYGDSFTQCVERAGNCWETLLEESPLAQELALLNFGVGGYGFDQTVMLFEATLERYREHDPIVLIGVLVDDDLDRCALSLRGWPKPHFRLEGESLVLEPPHGPSAADVTRVESLRIRSYVVRLVLHESGLVSPDLRHRLLGRADDEARVRAITTRLLDRVAAHVAEHGLDCRFVLFEGPERTRGEHADWRGDFLRRELDQRGLRVIDATAELRRVAQAGTAASAAATDGFFYLEGAGLNHLSTSGNRAAFGALERELGAIVNADYSPAATSIKR